MNGRVFLTGIGILSVFFIGYQISNTMHYNSSSTSVCVKDGPKSEEISQIIPLLRQIIEAQQRHEQQQQAPKILHHVPPKKDIEIPRTNSKKTKYRTSKRQQDPNALSPTTSPTTSFSCLGWKQTTECLAHATLDRDSLKYLGLDLSAINEDQLLEGHYYAKTCKDQIPSKDSGDLVLDWLEFPFFSEPQSGERIKQGQTIPIMSCWNGIIIATTKPIYENNVRFRRGQAAVDECGWSECGLFCLDYIKAGYSHIIMDPQVQVGYTIDESCRIWTDEKIPFNTDLSPPPWENFLLSEKFVCEPWRRLNESKRGQYWERYLFPPGMSLTESQKEPYYGGPFRNLPIIT